MNKINSYSKMGNSSSSKLTHTDKDAVDDIITINEKINLTKEQHEVLNMICNSYETSISEYMKEALIQSMKNDVEDGDFCDVLLKLDGNHRKNKNTSPSPSNNDLDMLKNL